MAKKEQPKRTVSISLELVVDEEKGFIIATINKQEVATLYIGGVKGDPKLLSDWENMLTTHVKRVVESEGAEFGGVVHEHSKNPFKEN